jgi:hypothetical protein
MRAMSRVVVLAIAIGAPLMAGCGKPEAPAPELELPPAEAATGAAAPAHSAAPAGDELPVPEAVATLHRGAFEARESATKLGGVVCYVTLHDAALEKGGFYPLVLFANGSVGTWRQTPAGAEEPFFAKLSSEEQAQATELVSKISEGRSLARQAFDRSALVMGVSLRVGGRQETHYFDVERMPDALGRVVAMLKHRLEETNRKP